MRMSTMKALGLLLALMVLVPLIGCSPKESPATEYITSNLLLLKEGGRYPKWYHQNNLIAFDQVVDGNYEIFVMKPDGSDVKCLTCNKEELPTGHKGQPYWHPSGKYIVFSAENDEYQRRKPNDMTVVPGISGRNNDVWIMTSDGSNFWRITNTPENGGIIRPSFSLGGKTLYWNEEWSLEKHPGRGSLWSVKDSPLGEKWGLWRIKLADISFSQDGPMVTNIRTVNINELYPGKVLLEGQGIQPDNKHLIFSAADITETEGTINWGGEEVFGREHWGDLYTTDLEGGSLVRLTSALYHHDENPEYSPDGSKIAWTQTQGGVGEKPDLYLMNAAGSEVRRLTYFHEPGHPEYAPKSGGGNELDWSPDGKQIIFSLTVKWELKYPHQKTNLYILTLGEGNGSSYGSPVKSITTVVAGRAKTVDWSHATNKIAFGKWGLDGYVDVLVMNPDGSDEECLTCDKSGCPQKHNGNPAWHPSGDYIVFTSEKENNPEEYSQWAIPGEGFNCDLWAMASNADEFYQLTDYPLHMRGIIHPHFSHDGSKLLWAERLGKTDGSSWGEWALKIADFVVGADGPYLANIEAYQPGEQHYFYESHAFSADDSKILFCANPESQSDVGFDIYEMDLSTQELAKLTWSPNDWDEHAQYSPDGKRIAWMSSAGFDIDFKSIEGHEWKKYLVTELWIMDADGLNKQRLTYFNEPGYPEYMDGSRCVVSDISWSPDGERIIALVAYEDERFAGLKSKIVIIELNNP